MNFVFLRHAVIICILALGACAHKDIPVESTELAQSFTTEPAKQKDQFAVPEKIEALSKELPSDSVNTGVQCEGCSPVVKSY